MAKPSRRASTDDNALRALVRAFGLLERAMQPYFAAFGITGSQWGILRALRRAEDEGAVGLRMTDLSQRLLVKAPSVTGALERLERRGLAVRDPSPGDSRAKQVRLTLRGRRLIDEVLRGHSGQIDRLLAGLDAEEGRELHRLLDKLSRHLGGLLDVRRSSGAA